MSDAGVEWHWNLLGRFDCAQVREVLSMIVEVLSRSVASRYGLVPIGKSLERSRQQVKLGGLRWCCGGDAASKFERFDALSPVTYVEKKDSLYSSVVLLPKKVNITFTMLWTLGRDENVGLMADGSWWWFDDVNGIWCKMKLVYSRSLPKKNSKALTLLSKVQTKKIICQTKKKSEITHGAVDGHCCQV